MRSGIDKVGERDERSRKPDGGAVQCGDEDLWVRVEGIGDFEVVGYKATQDFAPERGARGHHIRAAVDQEKSVHCIERFMRKFPEGGLVRREVTALARQDGDIDIITGSNFAHEA